MQGNLIMRIILFLGTIHTVLAADCQWSGCEGLLAPGQLICDKYDIGWYNEGWWDHQYFGSDCTWDTSKVRCCKPSKGGNCKWLKECLGGYACQGSLGDDWTIMGESNGDWCIFGLKKYKCCS